MVSASGTQTGRPEGLIGGPPRGAGQNTDWAARGRLSGVCFRYTVRASLNCGLNTAWDSSTVLLEVPAETPAGVTFVSLRMLDFRRELERALHEGREGVRGEQPPSQAQRSQLVGLGEPERGT